VGQEFVLADGRPPGQPLRMAVMRPQHFLKKNDVGVRRADRFTQLVQDKTAIENGETLVGIHRQYAQRIVWWISMHAGQLESRCRPLASLVPLRFNSATAPHLRAVRPGPARTS